VIRFESDCVSSRFWGDNREKKVACSITLLVSAPEGLAPVCTVALQESDKLRAT
jgi:hypothetical protein